MHAALSSQMSESTVPAILVRYPVRLANEAWVLPEGPVPETTTHHATVLRLFLLLQAWAQRSDRKTRIASNLAVRWLREKPGIGIDPDVCVFDPPPPEDHLRSVRLWQPGHVAPPLAFEVVSESHPYEDYATIQDRYAAIGTRELVVFDPLLVGPRALGGPVVLQLWHLRSPGVLERIHFGAGPVYSEVLQAWLHPEGTTLEIASDREGRARWQTGEERERAAREQDHAEKELEREARLAAEARVRDLERELAKR
jgi:Uma2 family endonuclease